MICHSEIPAAPPRSRRADLIANLHEDDSPPDGPSPEVERGRSRTHHLLLILVLVWAVAIASSVVRGSDPVHEKASPSVPAAKALKTSRVALNVPRKTAPTLQVAAWVDQKGPATPPQLQGKVQLVVFWGTHCPPCLRKIPKLQQVVKEHANSDLVVIGLHTTQISANRLQRFARDKGLNYAVAIDSPASGRSSFGKTTVAFKVRAIPQAAVVDRDGSLSYIGSFDDALKTAESLL